MVGRFSALPAVALLAALALAPAGAASCPEKINDCRALFSPTDPPLGAGSTQALYEVTTQVVAGGVEMTATMTAKAVSTLAAGALVGAKAGVTGTLTIEIRNASAPGPVHVQLAFGDPTGASYDGNMTGFEFDYDPASDADPRGEFHFEITAEAGGSLVLPIQLSVEDEAGNHEAAMAVLAAETPEAHKPPMGWLVPALIGLLVGALIAAIVLRRKP